MGKRLDWVGLGWTGLGWTGQGREWVNAGRLAGRLGDGKVPAVAEADKLTSHQRVTERGHSRHHQESLANRDTSCHFQ